MDESGELDKNELTKWSEKIEKQYIEKDVAEWVEFFKTSLRYSNFESNPSEQISEKIWFIFIS